MKIYGINPSVTPPDDRNNKSNSAGDNPKIDGDKIELSMQQDNPPNEPNNISGDKSGEAKLERIDWVRARAANGFYDKQGPTNKTVDLLIENHKLGELLDRNQLKKNGDNSDSMKADSIKKTDKIAEIRQRIEDGYYDDPVHLAELAEIIIKEFNIE